MWKTESYLIEAVVENIWWEKIINKSFEKKLNLIVEQIIKDNRFLALKKKFSISILFTGDKKINQLNKKFRKINSPTNILSFPSMPTNINTNNFLGDIVISSDTLIKEANNEKKIEEDHLIHLFIHGVLHLLGYDHETSYDAKIMETLEIKILKSLNINNPYKEII
ncbi:MAG: rRNA maturation RNase YbeY [Candidatus Puniceispirillales bacterium]